MTKASEFIPHPECMVPSGDCFRLSKCLAGCTKRAFHQHQSDLKALRHEIAMLEVRVLRMEQKK